MPPTRFLFPTDFSEAAGQRFRHALALAERQGATLHVLHVVDSETALLNGEGELEAFAEAHHADDLPLEQAVVVAEAPAPAIRDYATEHGIDLIVMGRHGQRGLRRLFLGSVAEEVVREAPCPVLTVRRSADLFPLGPTDTVLVPLDLSDASLRALPLAKQMASSYDARLLLLHVLEDIDLPSIYGDDIANPIYDLYPEIRERTEAEVRRAVRDADGPDAETAIHFAEGNPTEAAVDFAEAQGVDLIVLTRTGRRGLTRLLIGSTADGIIRAASCPVLVVPVDEEGRRAVGARHVSPSFGNDGSFRARGRRAPYGASARSG